jgi:hypothetical protein
LTLLATSGCAGNDRFARSQIVQPNGSSESDPHEIHSVWFAVAVTVLLSGEQFDVALKDTRGSVVSTAAANTAERTSLDTAHRASVSWNVAGVANALLWFDSTTYVKVYVPLPQFTTLDDTLTPFTVHDAAADNPRSSPSDRTMAVSVDPGPYTPVDGDSWTDTMPGVSRATVNGTDDDDGVDSCTADSAASVDLL